MADLRIDIKTIPYPVLEGILGFLDFSTLFNCFRFVPAIQEIWNGFTEPLKKQKLLAAKLIEDRPFYNKMGLREQAQVDRLIKTAILHSTKHDESQIAIQYDEFFAAAVHSVCIGKMFHERQAVQTVRKNHLTLRYGGLLKHLNQISTARLFDILTDMDRMDAALGNIGHGKICDCVKESPVNCCSDYEDISMLYGICGGLDVYLDALTCTKNFPFVIMKTHLEQYVFYLEERLETTTTLNNNSGSGFEFVGESITNRFMYQYRHDPEISNFPRAPVLTLLHYERHKMLEEDSPLMKDLQAFKAAYMAFNTSGNGLLNYIRGLRAEWPSAMTVAFRKSFGPENNTNYLDYCVFDSF